MPNTDKIQKIDEVMARHFSQATKAEWESFTPEAKEHWLQEIRPLRSELSALGVVVLDDNQNLEYAEKLRKKLAKKHDWYGQGLFDMYMDLRTDNWCKVISLVDGGEVKEG